MFTKTAILSAILFICFWFCGYKYEEKLLRFVAASVATIIFLPVLVYVIGAIQWN